MLIHTLQVEDSTEITTASGDRIRVIVQSLGQTRVRLVFDAPRSVQLLRKTRAERLAAGELVETVVPKENRRSHRRFR